MTPEESKALQLVRVNAAALKVKKAERAKPTNKSDFVRAHANLSASEVVSLAAKQGLRLSSQLVYMVRGASSKPTTAPTPTAKRGPGRPRKSAFSTADVAPAPVKRGPGRPRKNPLPAPGPSSVVARRGPGRPRKDIAGALTSDEKQLATLVLTIGLARTEQLLAGLKKALNV